MYAPTLSRLLSHDFRIIILNYIQIINPILRQYFCIAALEKQTPTHTHASYAMLFLFVLTFYKKTRAQTKMNKNKIKYTSTV